MMQDAPDIQETMSEGWTSEEQAALAKAAEKEIPLVEMFGPTVQGEGTVIGQQTYFLRFGLCDYRCTMCDSLHAVLPAYVKRNAQWLTQEDIWLNFAAFRNPDSTNWVTFSGGNPAIHDLSYLLGRLRMNGFKVNVETQGTFWKGWLGKVDSLTISPKGPGMGEKHNHETFMGFINKLHEAHGLLGEGTEVYPDICIKIVVFDQRDLDFAAFIFEELSHHDLFLASDTSNHFYLSNGNSTPPPPDGSPVMKPDRGEMGIPEILTGDEFRNRMLADYRRMYEDIQNHPILSKVRFLPQWHAFVWGNDQGH